MAHITHTLTECLMLKQCVTWETLHKQEASLC